MAKYKMNPTIDNMPTVEAPETNDDCAVEVEPITDNMPVETTPETIDVPEPDVVVSADQIAAKLTDASTGFTADACYKFKMAVNVHTEPDVDSLVVGLKGVTELVKPERVLDMNGYIWAEFHSSPKHTRYVALATSDGSEKYVD